MLIHLRVIVQQLIFHIKQGAAFIAAEVMSDQEVRRSRANWTNLGLLLPLLVTVRNNFKGFLFVPDNNNILLLLGIAQINI